MIKNNVALITESNSKIGYGHLYRCIALAQEFMKNELNVVFFCDNKIGMNILFEKLSGVTIFNTSFLKENIQNYSIVIFDLYKNSWINYKNIANNTKNTTTVSVIDFAFKEYAIETDFIFQIGFQEYNYKETIQITPSGKKIKKYSGNNFFIFRNEFRNVPLFKVNKDANKIMVSMGGSDPYKLTELVLESLSLIKKPLEINCILGAGFDNDRLEKLRLKQKYSIHKISIYHNIYNMAESMLINDIAIINGGNTRFELASLGIPFVSISFNNIQNDIANRLQINGIGKNLGIYFDISKRLIANSIESIITDFESRKAMSKKLKNNLKVEGTKNIFNLIINRIQI